jgi:hypothetical protein
MTTTTDDLAWRPAPQRGVTVPWLPFDAARSLHAAAVAAGVLPRSLRGWGAFERWLDGAERLTLGPWARRR